MSDSHFPTSFGTMAWNLRISLVRSSMKRFLPDLKKRTHKEVMLLWPQTMTVICNHQERYQAKDDSTVRQKGLHP